MAIDYTAPLLVVDDQLMMVELTKRILSRLGFEDIGHELNGEKAVARLRAKRYQLVICDMHMQPVSGLHLLRSMRQDDHLKNTQFLLMTGSVEPSIVVAAKKAGADAYILKPFTPEQLKEKLAKVFSGDHRG